MSRIPIAIIHSDNDCPDQRFYEKATKVKAEVAALLDLFANASHRRPILTCGAGKGAAEGRRPS